MVIVTVIVMVVVKETVVVVMVMVVVMVKMKVNSVVETAEGFVQVSLVTGIHISCQKGIEGRLNMTQ